MSLYSHSSFPSLPCGAHFLSIINLSLTFSPSRYLLFSYSLSLSLCRSLSLSHSKYLTSSHSLSSSISFFISLSLSPSLSVILCRSLFLFISLTLYISLTLCRSLFLFVSLTLTTSLCLILPILPSLCLLSRSRFFTFCLYLSSKTSPLTHISAEINKQYINIPP